MDRATLDGWCVRHLGSATAHVSRTMGYFSDVVAVTLLDGRLVIVKVRAEHPRVTGSFAVHEYAFRQGFPCPEPLVAPAPFDTGRVATAEAHVGPGTGTQATARQSAALFAAPLKTTAAAPGAGSDLNPPPAWVHWDHDQAGTWPLPDDKENDLNSTRSDWMDATGDAVRIVLQSDQEAPQVGHVDWVPQNVWWNGDGSPRAVHDWDSLAALSEPALVGVASAIYLERATVQHSDAFIAAYQELTRKAWAPAQSRLSWAAGLWVRLFDAKKDLVAGREPTLTASEAQERAGRTGEG
ncbi:MAG: hypothetical protein LC789_08085 [Actinobacteria bacterium]|nr:hypothetical protein [Actinomycetota bacterium]